MRSGRACYCAVCVLGLSCVLCGLPSLLLLLQWRAGQGTWESCCVSCCVFEISLHGVELEAKGIVSVWAGCTQAIARHLLSCLSFCQSRRFSHTVTRCVCAPLGVLLLLLRCVPACTTLLAAVQLRGWAIHRFLACLPTAGCSWQQSAEQYVYTRLVVLEGLACVQ